MKRMMLLMVVMLFAALPVKAQPMIEHVPEDAALYVGFTGWGELEKAYDQSHLKVMMEPNGQQWSVDQLIRYFIEFAKLENENDAKEMEAMYKMAAPSLKVLKQSPVAFYIIPNTEDPTKTQAALLVKAGKDAETFKDQIEGFIALADDEQLEEQLKISMKDGMVRLAVNAPEALVPTKSLANSAAFKSVSQSKAQPKVGAFFVYTNIEKINESAETAAQMAEIPDAEMAVPLAQKLLSVDSFTSFYAVAGFDGPNWKSYAWLEAKGELKGLPKMVFGKSIAPDTLKMIPATAMSAAVIRVDLNELIQLAVKEAKEMEMPDVDEQLAELDKMMIDQVGFDVRKDLVGSLGSDWGFFVDPEVSGGGPFGLVFFNKVKDANQVESSLLKLAQYMVKEIKESPGNDPEEMEKLHLLPRTHTLRGVKMHTAALPFLAPSFTLVNDQLVVALYPQTLADTVNNMSKAPSILEQKEVKALVAEMKGRSLVAMTYSDPKQNLRRSYPYVQMGMQTISGMVNVFNEESAVVSLPSYAEIKANLSPISTMVFADDSGLRLVSQEAFPGSSIFMFQETSMMTQSYTLAVLLPALNIVRRQAVEQNSKANLRGIYQGMIGYSAENNDKFPTKASQMILEDHLPVKIFVNPRYGDAEIPPFKDMKEAAKWADDNNDYVIYWDRLSMSMGPMEIVGHERLEDFDNVAVVFGDGHAETLPVEQVKELLEESRKAHERRMKRNK